MIRKVNTKYIALSALLGLLAAIFLVFYNKAVTAQGTEGYCALIIASIKAILSLKVLLVVAIFSVLIYVCLTQGEKASGFVFKNRFALCVIVFAVLVGFGISGTSMGVWASSTGTEQTGLLAGVSRSFRTDEYWVSTPMALSQYADSTGAFQYFSNVSRGTSTDVFLEYGQPVLDIVEVFRPFHWGYLFLPPAQGLSFYWCGRLVALFIVSFEMGRFITNDKHHLALTYAFLVTFAPVVQWWFATNGVVEMFVFAQLATLSFREFLLANGNLLKRLACVCVICICVGGYALTLYPAWQIPIAYVILALEVYVFLTYRKKFKTNRKEIAGAVCCVVVFILIFARVFLLSKETISTIINTAYPGNRVFAGGGCVDALFKWPASIFYAIKPDGFNLNVCENSTFVDFFPLPLVLSIVALIKNGDKDKLLIFLTCVVVFLDIYVVLGYPAIIGKVTLLNNCQPTRVAMVVGFPNIILLVRSLAILKFNQSNKMFFFALAFGLLVACLSKWALPEYVSTTMFVLIAIVFSLAAVALLFLTTKTLKSVVAIALVSLIIFTGGLVNPVQKGLDFIYENPTYKMVKQIHDQDASAKWASEIFGYGNFLITAGAPTINSVNIYPDVERWSQIDADGEHEEIYNRYAHIKVSLKKEGAASWKLPQADVFEVEMTPSDAKAIGVKYVFTSNDLDATLGENVVSLVSESGTYKVYQLL